MRRLGGTFVALNNTTFRTLWLATLASNLGGLIQMVGAAWMMTTLTPSTSMVALVQASTSLPILVCSLAAGVLADNFDRRKVMLVAQGFMAVTSIFLAVLTFQGLMTPWTLLAFTFLIGCGTALNHPSWLASFGDLVDRDEVPSAVSVNAMGTNLTRSVGPAAGGALVAVAGAAAAFAVNAVTYVAIIAALLAWRPDVQPRRLPPERFGGALATGLRYFAMSPGIVRTIIHGSVFCFAAIILQALLPLVARDLLGGGAFTYGVLLGCFGLGAVAGAVASTRVRARLSNHRIATIGFFLFAGSTAVIAVSEVFAVSALAMFLAGGCWLSILSLVNALVQMSSSRWVVGRMIALYMSGIFGAMTIGSWVWGLVSEAYGTPAALWAAAAVMALGGIRGLWAPLPDFAGTRLDPVCRFSEPALALDLDLGSGPIGILVEYEIAEGDVVEFLAAMQERRRIRMRDGARQWALLRDVEAPDTWIEFFPLPELGRVCSSLRAPHVGGYRECRSPPRAAPRSETPAGPPDDRAPRADTEARDDSACECRRCSAGVRATLRRGT